MDTMILVKEYDTNGYWSEILNIFYVFIILAGILTITKKNPIVSILFLIGLFSTTASYLIIIGLKFIGLSYLIVYVGAVSILFLFILMLINIRISELQNITNNSVSLVIIFITLFCSLLFKSDRNVEENSAILLNIKRFMENIFLVSSNAWDGNITEFNHITSVGSIMYTNYNMWLIISAYILLLAMVGSIVITMKKA